MTQDGLRNLISTRLASNRGAQTVRFTFMRIGSAQWMQLQKSAGIERLDVESDNGLLRPKRSVTKSRSFDLGEMNATLDSPSRPTFSRAASAQLSLSKTQTSPSRNPTRSIQNRMDGPPRPMSIAREFSDPQEPDDSPEVRLDSYKVPIVLPRKADKSDTAEPVTPLRRQSNAFGSPPEVSSDSELTPEKARHQPTSALVRTHSVINVDVDSYNAEESHSQEVSCLYVWYDQAVSLAYCRL